jgi:hypothetical protein
MSHIYAGARFSHNTKGKANQLWQDQYTDEYFRLMKDYKDQIIIEIGGHDHWEDLRFFDGQ